MEDPSRLDLNTMDLNTLDPNTLDLRPARNEAALRFLLTRRSTPARTLAEPGPDEPTLRLMLRAAARSPDHGKLEPWRFLLIRGAAREALAQQAGARMAERGATPEEVEKARRGFMDGAMIVAVISSPKAGKIPQSEQFLSAGVVTAALVNAALACGYGANWLTGPLADDAEFRRAALKLEAHERVAGFVHLGTPSSAPAERPRPDIDRLLSEL